ncbi:MAG: S-adenosylmethionine decarboxylase [Thermoplasmatales archaeon]|nr:S-adenosylmethionine decarboxylase [Thermoplasmatales archaeon]
MGREHSLELHGFNNLAKSLDLNLYVVEHTLTDKEKNDFITFIDEHYNSSQLKGIMEEVCRRIDATVLDVSTFDYDPHGASALLLLAEEDVNLHHKTVAHLDKSHVSLHTYPERHDAVGISTFRIDVSLSTCGNIAPTTVLNELFEFFSPDIAILDYNVRGYTRDVGGRKVFIEKRMDSLLECFGDDTLDRFVTEDFNFPELRSFYTRMIRKSLLEWRERDDPAWNEIEEIYLERRLGGD